MTRFWIFIFLLIIVIVIITFLFVRSILKKKNTNDDYTIPDIDNFIGHE